ncbi:MAG: hypothetical protein MUE67_05035 [Anaerolineales bacterium]|jgi:hypothetical protein|nr:hypothetical protein [Anaerolineales bacterium]
MAFDWLFLVAAFGAGVWGAAIGGLPSFILCGVAAMIGAATGALDNASYLGGVAFGLILGPQISFAGGAAAAVYAAKRGKLAGGRDIATALAGLKSPDVLLVGGLFGVIGYILWWAIAQIPLGDTGFTNPIALSIILNAIIARLMFGKTGAFGKVPNGDNRWRASKLHSWLPWQTAPLELLTIGLGFGIAVAYATKMYPQFYGLWFGVATVGLVFLQFGVTVPVWHHIALAAEQVMILGGADMWWGVAFAVLGAFLGDFYGQLFTAHGDSHIDPPSASLFTTFTIMALLKYFGVFAAVSGVASLIVALVLAAVLYFVASAMKRKPNASDAVAA